MPQTPKERRAHHAQRPHVKGMDPMTDRYPYPEILALWEDLPNIKLRYSTDETGWAKQLAPDVACIANISTSGTLRLYDVVQLIPHKNPDYYPKAGALLQRYYACTLGIRYPQGQTQATTRARFDRIARIIRDVGGCIEGMMLGFAMAQVPDSCDLKVVLRQLRQCRGVTAQLLHDDRATSAPASTSHE